MKKSLIIIAGTLIMALIGLFFGNQYYNNHFYAQSYIGAFDVSGLELDEAKAALNDELVHQSITFIENDEEMGEIPAAEVVTFQNMEQVIEDFYKEQHQSTHWFSGIFSENHFNFERNNHILVNQDILQQKLENIGITNTGRTPSKNATLEYEEENGYAIKAETQGNTLNIETLASLIVENDVVALEDAYITPTVTANDPLLQEKITLIDDIAETKITLTFSEGEETLPQEEIKKWLNLSDADELVIDESAIADYLRIYNDKYATINQSRPFQSTLSGEVTVQPGILGWSIDREAEAAAITEALYAGEEVTRKPITQGHEAGSGLDVGDSYIEVDLAKQHMFVYVDGEEAVSTPIISGRDGSNTTPGAYYIWNKETPSVLRGFSKWTGEEYATPVEYWLPFDWVGQGVHDANWQMNFGGDTWINSGSLGCINTPPEIMDDVFNASFVGMPVLVF